MTLSSVSQQDYLLPAQSNVGRVVSVTGSQAIVVLDDELYNDGRRTAEMGTLLTVETSTSTVLGLVSALSVPVPAQQPGEREIRIAELELVGELHKGDSGIPEFRRGVSDYPALGDLVSVATKTQLEQAYSKPDATTIRIGTLQQDSTIPAVIDVDELLGKHFSVLGSTGTGKSCTVALILRQILAKNPQAHVLLLDPHNEYATSFAGSAEVITPSNLTLPFWLFTFEELTEVVIGNQKDKQAETEILSELIPIAKHQYASNRGKERTSLIQRRLADVGGISVDTPVPYKISDLIGLIQDQIGRLDLRRDRAPFTRLKSRLESLSLDPRFAFMFGNLTVEDKMSEILGQLFRVPVNGKPITIFELTGLPSDIVSVVVSVICRMTFDFSLWSAGAVPVHLVCEEAHRYIPRDVSLGFEPAKRALSRIAKEGRKYGVSLCVVSQRPSELDPTILSQCNTIFAMRMSNELDQEIVKAAISDAAASLLDFLPSMSTGEAIAFGEGIALPGRIRFDRLPEHALPKGDSARFSHQWSKDISDTNFLNDVVTRWRGGGEMASEALKAGIIGVNREPVGGNHFGTPLPPAPSTNATEGLASVEPSRHLTPQSAPTGVIPATATSRTSQTPTQPIRRSTSAKSANRGALAQSRVPDGSMPAASPTPADVSRPASSLFGQRPAQTASNPIPRITLGKPSTE